MIGLRKFLADSAEKPPVMIPSAKIKHAMLPPSQTNRDFLISGLPMVGRVWAPAVAQKSLIPVMIVKRTRPIIMSGGTLRQAFQFRRILEGPAVREISLCYSLKMIECATLDMLREGIAK